MTRNLVIVGVLMVLSASLVVGVLGSDPGEDAFAVPEPSATVAPTATPEPTPTATPDPQNRQDCGEIRGTDYLSQEERQWFLANCVTG